MHGAPKNQLEDRIRLKRPSDHPIKMQVDLIIDHSTCGVTYPLEWKTALTNVGNCIWFADTRALSYVRSLQPDSMFQTLDRWKTFLVEFIVASDESWETRTPKTHDLQSHRAEVFRIVNNSQSGPELLNAILFDPHWTDLASRRIAQSFTAPPEQRPSVDLSNFLDKMAL